MTNDTQNVNEFLAGSGVSAAKFPQIGDTVKGHIVAAELRDQTDISTGEVKTYSDGNPMKQVVITLQTTMHEDDEDDGMRRVYAKGQMLSAIRKAVGRDGIQIGAKLAVRYAKDGKPSQRGFNPPKEYQVWYEAPKQVVNIGGEDNPLTDEADPAEFDEDAWETLQANPEPASEQTTARPSTGSGRAEPPKKAQAEAERVQELTNLVEKHGIERTNVLRYLREVEKVTSDLSIAVIYKEAETKGGIENLVKEAAEWWLAKTV